MILESVSSIFYLIVINLKNLIFNIKIYEITDPIPKIDNDQSFLSELESFFYSYRNSSYLNKIGRAHV